MTTLTYTHEQIAADIASGRLCAVREGIVLFVYRDRAGNDRDGNRYLLAACQDGTGTWCCDGAVEGDGLRLSEESATAMLMALGYPDGEALDDDTLLAMVTHDDDNPDVVAQGLVTARDLPRTWVFSDDSGCRYATRRDLTVDDAADQCEADAADGDYGDQAATVWATITATCAETGEVVSRTSAIDPVPPPCQPDGRYGEVHAEHLWASPHALLGGLKENPGVQGHGGGVVMQSVCVRCGCGRTIDTWAQRPDTGEQGLTSTTYEADAYDLDELGYAVEERDIDGDRRDVVTDASDNTYTVAANEQDAQRILWACRAGNAANYEWESAE